MIDLLHLSDLHFCSNPEVHRFIGTSARQLARRFLEPLKLKGVNPQYVVLSGDFVQDGDSAEFDLVRPFIVELLACLGLSRSKVVLIPGNHDIRWKRGAEIAKGDERTSSYKAFFELIRRREPDSSLSDFIVSDDVTLLAFNSSTLESLKCPGFGFVGDEQLEALWKSVRKEPGFNPDAPRIGVIHHHVLPVSWLEPLRTDNVYSLTLDAERLQQWFMKNGFRVLLHGHQHQPFLRAIYNPGHPSRDDLLISGAGSACGAKGILGEFSRNHYQVLRIDSRYIEVQWYQSDFRTQDAFEYYRNFIHPYGADQRKPPDIRMLIGISGGTSEQRTAFTRGLERHLAKKYSERISIELKPSPARDVIREGRGHDQQTRPEDYAVYLEKHMKNFNDASNSGLVVFDRTLLDTLAFAELNGNLPEEWLSLLQQTAHTIAKRLDFYFYLQNTDPASFQNNSYDRRFDDALWSVLKRYRPDAYNLSNDALDKALKIISEKIETLIHG
ncbi:MAG TPA: metallophosphoesterase [Candidatus Angelobacter sp.]|nr:metallophosphoesterase [Candidatus Angelobacter sp.]